jgi:hypothetical protein
MWLGLMVAASATAAPAKKPVPVPPSPPAAPPVLSASADEALTQLGTLYRTLEYDKVIPLADTLLARDDLTSPQRLEALRLLGSAKAIVQDPVDAERPFRLLLRARPSYDLPPDTPPKILAVFRKVQSEEVALAAQLKGVERSQLITNLKVTGEPAKAVLGGRPVRFAYRVRDTAGVVESMRVLYRRAGQKAFSALALERSEDGEWRGVIPGEFTAGDEGFSLEYVAQTADRDGPLLVLGSETSPLGIQVSAGQVPKEAFKPLAPPVFWTAAGFTVVSGIAAIVLGVLFNTTQSSFNQRAMMGGAGSTLTMQIERGETYAAATNVLMISTAILAAGTLMTLPFTRFSEE